MRLDFCCASVAGDGGSAWCDFLVLVQGVIYLLDVIALIHQLNISWDGVALRPVSFCIFLCVPFVTSDLDLFLWITPAFNVMLVLPSKMFSYQCVLICQG